MEDAFRTLCSNLHVEDSALLWTELCNFYSEKQRFYHNLRHIEDLYSKFVRYHEYIPAEDCDIVLWAIFYHDIIYNPTSKTNEEDSAALFQQCYSTKLPEATVSKVLEYILATKTHSHSASTTSDTTLQLFLDLDLSILAAPSARYQEYAREIRLEYQHFEDDAYQQGRSAVLRQFLSTPALFTSPFGKSENWETVASENIQWEINELSKETPRSNAIFGA